MKHEQWLLSLLPKWREEGLLTPEAEGVLRERYAPDERATPLWFVFLGSLGALLVGLGVITLFAANWEAFGRPARAVLSFVPLCLSLALYGAGVWRGWDKKTGFLDVAGILWALSVGACIALIAQTYQISSDGRSFVLAWTLLLLPVMYATRSFVVTAGHYTGLVIWMGMTYDYGFERLWVLPLAALGMPVALGLMRAEPECRARGILLRWAMVVIGCVAYGFVFETRDCYRGGEFILFAYGVLFAALMQAGFLRPDGAELLKRPWAVVGTWGLLVVTSVYAFGNIETLLFLKTINLFTLGVTALLLAGLCVLSVARWRACHKKWFYPLAFGIAPVFYAMSAGFETSFFTFLYFVALGITVLHSGISERRLGRANLGSLIILACILEKFFASELPLTLKAMVFILAGAAFFGFSFYMYRVMRNGGSRQ